MYVCMFVYVIIHMDKLSNDPCQLRAVLMSCKMDQSSMHSKGLLLQKAFLLFNSGLTPTQTFCALTLLQIAKSQNWKLT